MISCYECQPKIIPYLHDELPAPARRKIRQHLDQCTACYGLYANERDLARELEFRMPLVGQAQPAQLRKNWSAVQRQMQQPKTRVRFRLRYGVAAFMFMLALLLPWKMQSRVSARFIPLPPVPAVEAATQTPNLSVAKVGATLIAYSTEDKALLPTRAPVPNKIITP
jgi:anti-sigma factor RsiW